MARRFSVQVFRTTVAVVLFWIAPSRAQSPDNADAEKAGALFAKAPALNYPAIARIAHVTGVVDLSVGVRQNGSVESVVVNSGPYLLRQAAMDNARGSQFDCRACDRPVTEYSLVYEFQLDEPDACPGTEPADGNSRKKPYPQVARSPGHVTIVDQTTMICDPVAVTRKVRAAKCLYLWKCGIRCSTSETKSSTPKSQ